MSTKHFPADPNSFVFDASVTAVFDDMAVRSIPGYQLCHEAITYTMQGRRYPAGSQIWDFGTSTGRALASVRAGLMDPLLDYRGVDVSLPMVERARKSVPFATIEQHDLLTGMPADMSLGGVAVAIFGWTLQFIPSVTTRMQMIAEAYYSLQPGGVMFIFEKFAPTDPEQQRLLNQQYMWWRRANGYTFDEISAKTRALANSMWPWPHEALVEAVQIQPRSRSYWLYMQSGFGGMVVHKDA